MMFLWLVLGCSNPVDTAEPVLESCSLSDDPQYWALSALSFATIEDNVSVGFDLDDAVTETGDSTGCGVGDAVSPDGTEGIDNAFGRMLPALEGTEFIAADGLIAASISSGELLLVAGIGGVDSWENDDCVSTAVYRGSGSPMLTTDEQILPDQTLTLDPDFPAQVFDGVALTNGSVQGRPLNATIPFQILEASIEIALTGGAVQYDIQEDGTMKGMLAGGMDIAYLLDILYGEASGIDDDLTDLIATLLPVMADLNPDENGECTHLSVTFEFEAVPVFVYEETLPD